MEVRERLTRGFEMTKVSLRVVLRHKRIMILPLLGGVAGGGLAGSFVGGAIAVASATGTRLTPSSAAVLAASFAAYLLAYLVLVYTNAAIAVFALALFARARPTVRGSLRVAIGGGWGLLGWAALAATVGLAIRAAQVQAPNWRYEFALTGLAWTFLVPLVAPVLISEGLGPLKAFWRSGSIRRRTWLETLGGLVSLYGLSILAGSFGLIPLAAGWVLGGLRGLEIGIAIAVVYWVPLFLVASTAKSVLVAATYHYGTTGSLPTEFRNARFPEGRSTGPESETHLE